MNMLGFGKWLCTCSLHVRLLMALPILNLQIINWIPSFNLLCVYLSRGQEMKYLQCSLHPYRFHTWDSLGPQEQHTLIIWSLMRLEGNGFCCLLGSFFVFVVWILMHLLFPFSLFHPPVSHIFILKSWFTCRIATLWMIINRLVPDYLLCLLCYRKCIFKTTTIAFRKIWMCWIQRASTSDLIMASLKINLYLHASISCTKWILKSLILGNPTLKDIPSIRFIFINVKDCSIWLLKIHVYI